MITNILKNISQCALANIYSNVIIFNMRRDLFKFFKKLERFDDKHPNVSSIIFASLCYTSSICDFMQKSYLKASLMLLIAIILTIIIFIENSDNKN